MGRLLLFVNDICEYLRLNHETFESVAAIFAIIGAAVGAFRWLRSDKLAIHAEITSATSDRVDQWSLIVSICNRGSRATTITQADMWCYGTLPRPLSAFIGVHLEPGKAVTFLFNFEFPLHAFLNQKKKGRSGQYPRGYVRIVDVYSDEYASDFINPWDRTFRSLTAPDP
jgi:hypothetical protein